jgi:ABC-2 type transport system permease protein
MRMIMAVVYREFRIRTTSLTWAFADILIPLIYLLLFGVGFDKAFAGGVRAGGQAVAYTSFFLGGVLAMAGFTIALNTAYGFFVDRENGLFYEFLTYPMTRAQFLIGKILFNCLLSLGQTALTIGIGSLVIGLEIHWEKAALLIAGIVLGTAGWFFFMTPFAIRIRRNDMFNTFLNIAYFVLMFASTLFYPADQMPAWLRVASYCNPLTWHTDVLRYATIGTGSPDIVLLEGAAFVLFLLGFFWFSVHTLRRGVLA